MMRDPKDEAGERDALQTGEILKQPSLAAERSSLQDECLNQAISGI
jgi:hypothetical protein